LWKTDGTGGNTSIVKELCATTCSSSPQSLTNVNGTLYFTADTGSGRVLYKSDGTDPGTVPVASSGTNPQNLIAAGTKLFYSASDASFGNELWVYDGATATRLSDINSGVADASPAQFAVRSNILYFAATSGSTGRELYKSDGTGAGTGIVSDISSGGTSSNPINLYTFGSYVYFSAFGLMFRTDGTGAQLFVTYLGASFSAAGPYLYFAGTAADAEPYRTDGTVAGTIQLADINRSAPSGGAYPLGDAGGRYVYLTFEPSGFPQPWVSNGLNSGTHEIGVVNPSGNLANNWSASISGVVFFDANDGTHGSELWVTDGTSMNLVKDINLGGSSNPRNLIDASGTLYFGAFDGVSWGLYKSNGSEATTTLINQIGSTPTRLTNVNGTVYFVTGNGPQQLWKSNGTALGTVQVPASSFNSIEDLTAFNGQIFFRCDSNLCKSDGTTTSTLPTTSAFLFPQGLEVAGNALFFSGGDTATGIELYKTDGSTISLVKDIAPGTKTSRPGALTNLNGTLLFFADDATHGYELWRSDGTEGGTVLVADANPGHPGSGPFGAIAYAGLLWYAATDGTHGLEMWRSDGVTAAGGDLEPGSPGSVPSGFLGSGGRVFLNAYQHPIGNELFAACPRDVNGIGIDGPLTVTAGVPANYTFSGRDMFSAVVACYAGTMHFASNDPNATVPANYSFANETDGSATLPVTLRTAGTRTIFAQDITNLWGYTVNINVVPAAASATGSTMTASASRILTNGGTSTITVQARDAFGNARTTGGDTVTLQTSAGSIGTVTDNGNGTYTATLTAGASPAAAAVTGTLNGNAMSAGVTVQIVNFIPVRGDNDGDGRADIIWRHATSGANYLWKMNGTSVNAVGLPSVPDPNWKIVGVADYDGDGNSDYFWRYTGAQTTYLWRMNGANFAAPPAPSANATQPYDNIATGDTNGDGRSDMLWRDLTPAITRLWLMNGPTVAGDLEFPQWQAMNPWRIAGMGDVDGDGRDDVIWYYPPSGIVAVWLMNGGTIVSSATLATVSDTEWQIAGVADFSGDGRADLLWRRSTGETYLWVLNGLSVGSSAFIYSVPDTAWKIVAVGDLDGDRFADIFWRHDVTGSNYVWLMHGSAITTSAALPAVPDLDWKVVGPR